MNQISFFSLLLIFLLPGLYGCFSTEKKEAKSMMAKGTFVADPAPAARTPEEAVRQLLEGNSRYAHNERRWLQLSSSQVAAKPFAVVINAGAGNVTPEEIFDLPRGSVPLLTWSREHTDWNALDANVNAGVKLVLVLLPYRQTDLPQMVTSAAAAETPAVRAMQTVCRQLQLGSSALSGAVARQRCQLLGAMLHPVTQRLVFLPASNQTP